MRRLAPILILVVAAGVAGAFAYSVYATERDFERFVRDGDEAVTADLPYQAIEAYSGAIALRPDSIIAHLKRGIVYRTQGALEDALRDLRRASDLDPTATRALELVGDLHLQLTRFDRAIERYQNYLAVDDQSPHVQYKLGLAFYRAGRAREALEPLRRALALNASLEEARFLLGLCQRDDGDLTGARDTLQSAVERVPAAVAPREALAGVYGLLGDEAKAIEQLEALAALEPARPERLVAVGMAQADAGRREAAVRTLGRAVERYPESPRVYAALGHVWLSLAEARQDRVALKKAIEALVQAAAYSDTSSETLAELGRAWMLDGDRVAAERTLRQAVSRLPVPAGAYLHLAAVTERAGRIQDSRDALIQYATLVGDQQPLAAVATRIAQLSVRLGDPVLAVRWFERALDEAGPTAVLLARLADAALRAGDVDRARAAVGEGLALAPQDQGLLAVQRRLP
jgi:tetratricopeptide (TPR) repeat protein